MMARVTPSRLVCRLPVRRECFVDRLLQRNVLDERRQSAASCDRRLSRAVGRSSDQRP